MHHVSCLCGKVRFSVAGDLSPPTACHCTKCRKQTGHYEAGTDVPRSAVTITGEDEVWDDFDTIELAVPVLNAVKSYVTLKVRLDFDPPGTPHHIQAIKDQITELEHTLLTERDLVTWSPPSSPSLP